MQFVALQRQAAAGIPPRLEGIDISIEPSWADAVDAGQRHATAEQPVEIQGAGQRRQRIARQGDAGTDGPDSLARSSTSSQSMPASLVNSRASARPAIPAPWIERSSVAPSSGIRRDFAQSRQACRDDENVHPSRPRTAHRPYQKIGLTLLADTSPLVFSDPPATESGAPGRQAWPGHGTRGRKSPLAATPRRYGFPWPAASRAPANGTMGA